MKVHQWVWEGKLPAKLELQGKSRDEQQYTSYFAALGIADGGCLTITAMTLTGVCFLMPPELQWDAFYLAHGAAMAS